MPGNLLTFISAAAFAAFVLCFAELFMRAASFFGAGCAGTARAEERGGALSSALCVAAFFFVPIGSLPPFFSFGFGGFAAALLLAASALLNIPRRSCGLRALYRALAFPFVFCVSWGALAFFASREGLPGAPGSLGTYAATPFFCAAGAWGRGGGLLLIFSLLCAFPKIPAAASGARSFPRFAPEALRASLCSALCVSLLIPWNFSAFVGIGGAFGFFFDFIFFWVKVAAFGVAAGWARRLCEDCARGRLVLLSAFTSLCGAACLFVEAGIF